MNLVVTEDSDLLLFGAKQILYKLDNKYQGILYKLDNLKYCEEMNLKNMSHSKFIQMCVLSGCDYLNSLKGIGLKTAYLALQKYKDAKEFILNQDKEIEENYL